MALLVGFGCKPQSATDKHVEPLVVHRVFHVRHGLVRIIRKTYGDMSVHLGVSNLGTPKEGGSN